MMGRRGPRKKLAALDRLDGNPSRRIIEEVGVEALGEPFIPEHLSDDARGCIDLIKQSMPANIYSALDSFLLSAFATAWAIHKRATHEISGPGFKWIATSKRGAPQESAWIKIVTKQAAILAGLGDRLGLDPKSRAALKLPEANQRKSKFAGLIGGSELSKVQH
jgi:P27 family predicted phage terminase small subunit